LGEYLDDMVKILLAHHAYVDKFIGDAIMGVWGFPFEDVNQASHAFACAKKMVDRAAQKTIGGKPVKIGVGLSSGTIFCGNVGSDLKRQFTVLGPPVNLAARCESACKEVNASILLSEEVYDRLDPTEKSELLVHPVVSLKGIGEVRLYGIGNQRRRRDRCAGCYSRAPGGRGAETICLEPGSRPLHRDEPDPG
jgi:class 3 adenylate cyclase